MQLEVSGTNANNLTIQVVGALTNPNDVFDVNMNAETANSSLSNLAINGIEQVNLVSTGKDTYSNTIAFAANSKLQSVIIDGDKDLTLSFSAANGTNSVKSVDASNLSADFTLNVANLAVHATDGLHVKASSGVNTITTAAERVKITNSAGGDDTYNVIATAAGTNTMATAKFVEVVGAKSGDVIQFSTAAITYDPAKTNVAAATSLDAAIGIANGTTVSKVEWFTVGTDAYLVYAGDTISGLSAADIVVKLTGAAGEFSSLAAGGTGEIKLA